MDIASSNRISYSKRLFLWLLGYSALLVVGFVAFQYYRERQYKAEKLNSQLQLINTYILTELEEGKSVADIDLREFHPFDDLRVSVISDKGRVVYDNTLDKLPATNHLGRSEIQQALATGTGYTVRRHSESTGDSYFYSASQGDHGYIVRTAVPWTVSLSSLLSADYGFLWITGGIALIMCILGYFATRRLGLHILRLNRFAEGVEKGARISDTEPFPHDELGDISNHIVRLYAKLQQAYAERDREHREALHQQQEKERIKKQLTNNINHELKTPVASIRICVETLLAHSDLPEERRRVFLDKCLANTDRLQRLLNDVALITRMDDAPASIAMEEVDLGRIIAESAADRALTAGAKGMVIADRIAGPIPMKGNASLLEAVFNNLIDNAIAYSGGSTVEIALLSSDDGKAVITLTDDGNGVSPEHLPHLFERFYRIDKGRSRSAGGTGLGLSIVRNAVAIHGGRIAVKNVPTGGLRFVITLPISSEDGGRC